MPHRGEWRSELDSRLQKVQAVLESFNAGDSLLDATIEPGRGGRVVTLRLHLPGKRVVAASGEGPDAAAATEQAAERLSGARGGISTISGTGIRIAAGPAANACARSGPPSRRCRRSSGARPASSSTPR